MLNLMNFMGIILFMILFSFMIINPTLLNFILLGELMWMNLYSIMIMCSTAYDSLIFLSWGLLMLCIAAGESVVGLSFIMFKFMIYNYHYTKQNNLIYRKNHLVNYI